MDRVLVNLSREDLDELQAALSARRVELAVALAMRCYTGRPDEEGIQMCIQRQKVEDLLHRLEHAAMTPKQPFKQVHVASSTGPM